MDVSEISRLPLPPLAEAPTIVLAAPPSSARPAGDGEPSAVYQLCDECGAAVDADQRYCVRCGAHRRHVNDPAARYLSQATSRARASRPAPSTGASPGAGGRTRGLGTALALAVVPLAVAVGVTVGRSSNNEDAQLLQALARRQAIVGAATTASPSSAATSGSATAASGGHRGKQTSRSSSHTGRRKTLSSTKYGTASQLAGSKPTQAQKQQGAAVVQKVQQSKGKSYVQQQSGLPGTVVVP